MTDYSELVRKMRTCIGDKKCFEKECRYWSELGCMDGNICCDAADAIEALQAQLTKQGEIVRCRECKHHEDEEPGMVYCLKIVGSWVSENWFCADGEREVQE